MVKLGPLKVEPSLRCRNLLYDLLRGAHGLEFLYPHMRIDEVVDTFVGEATDTEDDYVHLCSSLELALFALLSVSIFNFIHIKYFKS